jgi:predicted short-subunit dehydrogenase-like oxidoreductase (DUF2520 family)
MRELDQPLDGHVCAAIARVAIVGHGRLGTLVAAALTHAGIIVDGPYRRDQPIGAVTKGAAAHGSDAGDAAAADTSTVSALAGPDAILLCVPDAEIAAVASAIGAGAPVGHCSGATALDVLAGHEGFSLHPLMTVPVGAPADVLAGSGAAVAGTTAHALAIARGLAELLAMRPIEIAGPDRVAYHTAACIASNFLVTLQDAAERVAATAGLPRELLVPLVRATVENWATLGPERALTGPIARGDAETVKRQRAVLARRAPELLELFDACIEATRGLAARASAEAVVA